MKQGSRSWIKVIGLVAGLVVLVVAAFVAGQGTYRGTSGMVSMEYASMDSAGIAGGAMESGGFAATPEMNRSAKEEQAASDGAGNLGEDRLVIKNAGVSLRVEDIDEAVDQVRTISRKFDAEITDLYIDTPSDGPRPLSQSPSGPSSAQITVRVPAQDVERLTAELDSLGTVLSQTSSANDVTEQYIDLEARLKNLRAEESRLREFLQQAEDVKDLLAVQTELSRVRGEIEAMTAQITFLERQTARATLTVSLSESGPLVSPDGQDWGFRRAITDGLRGAVALLTTTITALIAISPLLALAGVAWFVVRVVKRRRDVSTPSSGPDVSEGA